MLGDSDQALLPSLMSGRVGVGYDQGHVQSARSSRKAGLAPPPRISPPPLAHHPPARDPAPGKAPSLSLCYDPVASPEKARTISPRAVLPQTPSADPAGFPHVNQLKHSGRFLDVPSLPETACSLPEPKRHDLLRSYLDALPDNRFLLRFYDFDRLVDLPEILGSRYLCGGPDRDRATFATAVIVHLAGAIDRESITWALWYPKPSWRPGHAGRTNWFRKVLPSRAGSAGALNAGQRYDDYLPLNDDRSRKQCTAFGEHDERPLYLFRRYELNHHATLSCSKIARVAVGELPRVCRRPSLVLITGVGRRVNGPTSLAQSDFDAVDAVRRLRYRHPFDTHMYEEGRSLAPENYEIQPTLGIRVLEAQTEEFTL